MMLDIGGRNAGVSSSIAVEIGKGLIGCYGIFPISKASAIALQPLHPLFLPESSIIAACPSPSRGGGRDAPFSHRQERCREQR